MVNVNGESNGSRGRETIEKMISLPHTVTLPPSKTCTTSTRLQSLWISIVEDDTTAGVLREGTVRNNMSQVVAKSTKLVWTVVGGVAEAATKRTVVSHTSVLGVTRGVLAAVGPLILQTVNTKMPRDMAVKATSLLSCCGLWAQWGSQGATQVG